jgi:bacterial/archaeal transporter family-2 protein
LSSSRRAILAIAASTTFLASVGVNLQIRANSQLAIEGVDPPRIALVNMVLQLGLVILAILLARNVRAGFLRFIAAIRQRQVKFWWFIGGLIGASIITLMGVVTPLVGVAVFSIAMVSGQTASSLVVDRLGLGPGGKRSLTKPRAIAAFIAVVAVVVSVGDRVNPQSGTELAWGAAVLALAGGFAISFQAAANGRIAMVSGQPAIGAGVNFAVGTVFLTIISIIITLTSQHDPAISQGSQPSQGIGTWWLYLAAIFGFLIVLNTAWAVRHLGVLLLTVIGVLGQMLGALVMDIVVPTEGVTVTLALLSGLALAVAAVAIGAYGQWKSSTMKSHEV